MTRARRAVAPLVLLLGLAAAGRLAAEDPWYDLYQNALKSIQQRKWTEAERRLTAAMAAGPPSGRQVKMYGVRFIDYLPEYHLGRVYFNELRYADALEQLTKVQASNLVKQGDAEYQPLVDMIELSRMRTAPNLADGQKEAAALVRFARELMARSSLDEARRALDTAVAKDPAGKDVAAAREELVRLETEKRIRADQERRTAELAKPSLPPPQQSPPPVAPSPATSLAARPDARVTRDVAQERAAYRAFYSGDYAAAAEAFERLAGNGATAGRERLLVYAACGRAALALLKGKDGDAELRRARSLFAAAGPGAARIVARDGLVSPRVAALLKEAASP